MQHDKIVLKLIFYYAIDVYLYMIWRRKQLIGIFLERQFERNAHASRKNEQRAKMAFYILQGRARAQRRHASYMLWRISGFPVECLFNNFIACPRNAASSLARILFSDALAQESRS